VAERRYAVVFCPRCGRGFVIVTRWKRVRCRRCGRSFAPDYSKVSLCKTREEAVRQLLRGTKFIPAGASAP